MIVVVSQTSKSQFREPSPMKSEIDPSKADAFTHALAGGAGGALSMALTYPLVAVTTRLQTQTKNSETDKLTLAENVKEIYKKDGILGFFAGLESAMLGMTLSNFVYYYCYEASSRCLMRARRTQKLSTAESMLVGSIAGSVNAVIANPLWVANTRMTVDKSDRGVLTTIANISKTEGLSALFSGLKPALVLVINPIIQYTVYEQLKNRVLESRQKRVLSPSWAFLLGALGKLAATGSTYPYVTMKARMHLSRNEESSPVKKPKSLLSLMNEVIKKDGLLGLYSGIGVKLVQSILTAAFLFFFKEGLVIWSMKLLRLLRTFNRKRKVLTTAGAHS
ncbi:LAQU0S04e02014g1_1 [Lachancea quebecensis]|uniref:LAQU0S04e02014g1_1 n=1 Tax=Lachancea quebecensis TaxID=1654605 RepID=A0A0P1KPD4_9SACH|nr:LAQU0S04e02014g1_1 [Lachancea quebecensis]